MADLLLNILGMRSLPDQERHIAVSKIVWLGQPWPAPLLGPLLVPSRGISGSMKWDSLAHGPDVSVTGRGYHGEGSGH